MKYALSTDEMKFIWNKYKNLKYSDSKIRKIFRELNIELEHTEFTSKFLNPASLKKYK